MMRGRFGIALAAAALSAVVVTAAAMPTAGAVGTHAVPAGDSWMVKAERAERALRAEGMHATPNATPAVTQNTPADLVADPVGDVPSPEGDIVGAGFAQGKSSFVFGSRVETPTDPSTDPAWQQGTAQVAWAIDTNHDENPEYVIFLLPGFAGLEAELLSADGSASCSGTGTYVPSYGYTAAFANTCLPAGLAFQFQAAMSYTLDPNDMNPPVDYAPDNNFSAVLHTAARQSPSGYWMLGADGRVYAFGGAVAFPGVVPHAVAMVPRKDGKGYWVTDSSGHVSAYGTATFRAGAPRLNRGEAIRTMATTPTGNGYWLFSNEGRVFNFGDAHLLGDMSGTHLNGSIVASAATPSGNGYYMIGSDGGIFAFGDAAFRGSTGDLRLNKPIVGMAAAPAGKGYWLVGSDGGVFAFGAPFRGSMGGKQLNRPVAGLVPYGNGYLMGASDGGVFDFSNKPFFSSLAENAPSAPIIGLAAFGS